MKGKPYVFQDKLCLRNKKIRWIVICHPGEVPEWEGNGWKTSSSDNAWWQFAIMILSQLDLRAFHAVFWHVILCYTTYRSLELVKAKLSSWERWWFDFFLGRHGHCADCLLNGDWWSRIQWCRRQKALNRQQFIEGTLKLSSILSLRTLSIANDISRFFNAFFSIWKSPRHHVFCC